jgi:hypothetical protein
VHSLAFKLVDRLADGRVVDHFGLCHSAGNQRRRTDLIESARDTLGPVSDALEGVIGEVRSALLESGDLKVMLDVSQRGLQWERLYVAAMGDALAQLRLVTMGLYCVQKARCEV